MSAEPVTVKARSTSETQDKLFYQAAMKGYETEIASLKKEIEQLHETAQVSCYSAPSIRSVSSSSKHEVKIATSFLNEEKDRLAKELATANRALAQSDDVLSKKDEQIRDLSNRSSLLSISPIQCLRFPRTGSRCFSISGERIEESDHA